MSRNWSQGKYIVENPEKYLGDPDKVTYRSSWELFFNQYVDRSPHVLKWSSEQLQIHYYHPFYKKMRTYYPDYFVEYKDKDGVIHREIIEIKPENQIFLSSRPSKDQKITHMINMSKWSACKQFCEEHKIVFRLCTEKQLFK